MSTSTINQPSGYTVPSSFYSYVPVTDNKPALGINSLQLNVLNLNQEFLYQAVTLDSIESKITALDSKVANMQPQVITESISFLLGAFIAIAFVLSSKLRY